MARWAFVVVALAAATLFTGAGVPARAATGRTFYLSPQGNDNANGQTQATAWKTLWRANQEQFKPGDQILLQGGAVFYGQLLLLQDDAGTTDSPVVVSSYGSGRATIHGSSLEAIKVYDAGGIEINNLNIVGDASTYNDWDGVLFYADNKVPGRLTHIKVTNVDVSGFRRGITLAGASAGSGFQDVTIANSVLHNNRDEGLLTYGPDFDANNPTYSHSNVQVRNVTARDNAGNPQNTTSHSGSGIILGSVDTGVIEASSAYGNGSACASKSEGPVGIWTYDSTKVTIQRNVSYQNKTGTTADGGGFDLDQNVSNSVIQYNLSYGNMGPGLLVFTAQTNDAQRANVVRYNVSVNDAVGNGWYGGLTVAGRIVDASIYNNTIVTRPGGAHRPAAAKLTTGLAGVTFKNNILYSQGAGAAVSSATAFSPSEALFQANSYYRQGGGSAIEWGDGPFDSLKAWRKATGQETSGRNALGIDVDPGLQNPSATPSVTDPGQVTSVTQFALAGDSPAGGRGLSVNSTGTVDYFGAMLGGTRPVSIGAAQPATALASTAVTGTADTPSTKSHWLLWTIAFVLLLLVGGIALTVFTLQLRRRRRPVGWGPPQTIVVPSDRGNGRLLDDEYQSAPPHR